MIPAWLIRYGLGALAILGALWVVHHHGVESGKAARDQYWQPKFIAAEKAAAEANAHTAAVESSADAITAESEARHAEKIAALNARAADADSRIRALSVRIAARRACSGDMPTVSGTSPEPHAAAPGDERADRAGGAIADIGRRCESDAASLGQLQQWIREQAALMR